MKKRSHYCWLILVIVVFVVSISSFTLVNAQIPAQGTPAMIIPAYVYPTYWNGSANVLVGSWKTLDTTHPDNPDDIIIANVDTGPCDYSGSTCTTDPSYTMAIDDAVAEGWKIYGYIDTGYLGETISGNGSTPRQTRSGSTLESAWISQIETDETEWYNEWGNDISGLFLDDVTGLSSDVATYQSLAKYDSNLYGGNIIFNPGDAPSSSYTATGAFNSGNSMQFFESCYSSAGTGCSNAVTWNPGVSPISYSPSSPTYYTGIPAMFTVYSTPTSDMSSVISTAKAFGARYVYVSNQDFGATSQNPDGTTYCSGSPYCNLPSYFATENAALVQLTVSSSNGTSGASTVSNSPAGGSSVSSNNTSTVSNSPAGGSSVSSNNTSTVNQASPSTKSQTTVLSTKNPLKTDINHETYPLSTHQPSTLKLQSTAKQPTKSTEPFLEIGIVSIVVILIMASSSLLVKKLIIPKKKPTAINNENTDNSIVVRHF